MPDLPTCRGFGSWVVTRPTASEETDLIPHYFVAGSMHETRTPEVDASSSLGSGRAEVARTSGLSSQHLYLLSLILVAINCS